MLGHVLGHQLSKLDTDILRLILLIAGIFLIVSAIKFGPAHHRLLVEALI